MKYLILPFFLISSFLAVAQTNNNYFAEGQIFGHISSGYQFSTTQKKLDPLGDAMQNKSENITLFSFPELEIILPAKVHFKLGFQAGIMNQMDVDVLQYINDKYGNNYTVMSSGNYSSNIAAMFRTSIGSHYTWKKLLLQPNLSLSSKTYGINNYRFLMTNNITNEAHTFFLNHTDSALFASNKIVKMQYGLNCKIFSHNKNKVLNFYIEPGLNYSRKSTDIIRFEREELTGKAVQKDLDYRNGNLNLSLQLGMMMRLIKIKF
jgi:hypothetical protein